MKSKTYDSMDNLGKELGLSKEQIAITKLKTKLKLRIAKRVQKLGLTMPEVAEMSGLTRSVVSGIINGSLQSVSLERLLKIAYALDLSIDFTIKKAA
ncbi:MAG: XRE family transcriptional regulator [Bdellovibrionales bacterium]|jgi:predicted XRE-type DNA-binding protein|nr:XRE family transcriptional regulator [Bdellovibrionales bacterium]MBT3524822.1 XRE family transcriptional regulator [Bdellovibrionales bacterium]MBT7668966.1 XRE family transcriptional regulator [Bdellovibrionales bacterium]MBT7767488.1 XRE family transcriptional regulator [Bdellovibrionales bacterium]